MSGQQGLPQSAAPVQTTRSDARRSGVALWLWGLGIIAVYLLLSWLVDLAFGVNEFLHHLAALPLIVASSAPYVALASLIGLMAFSLGDWFFSRSNRRYMGSCPVTGDGCTLGIVHEIAHDDNLAAVAFVVAPPALWVGILLFFAVVTKT